MCYVLLALIDGAWLRGVMFTIVIILAAIDIDSW